MSAKNIVLVVICVISVFFIVRSLLRVVTINPTFAQEQIKCRMASDWLKKKNVSSCVLLGMHDTLTTHLEKESFRIDSSIPFDPERKFGEFVKLVSVKGIKCIVFIEFVRPEDSIKELQDYLKSGNLIYIKNFSDVMFDNDPLTQSILDAMKKGQVCAVMQKVPDSDVRNMSNEKKVLSQYDFFDDTNYAKFETAFKEYKKRKEEFMKMQPQPGM